MTGHVAIIGFGAIAQELIAILCAQDGGAPGAISILVREGREKVARTRAQEIIAGRCSVEVMSDLAGLLAGRPDVLVECAGHGAVQSFGAVVLAAGTDMIVASVGALADAALEAELRAAAAGSGAQLTLPAGAIGGVDVLAAARLAGIADVTYTGRKPPEAWRGTPAEAAIDLGNLAIETVFFEGSAREAASAYPKNANVAATLALAGLGMDATRVRLVADPGAQANSHEFSVRSNAVDFSMTLTAKPSPLNPKTSASTVYSIARAVLNRSQAIVI